MSSKITNAGGDPSKRQPNETSNPRGPPTNGTQKTTNGYGKSRGENDSYYGTSTPPHPMAATDTSMYTGVGGSGMYNPAFAPLSSYLSQPTTSPMPPSPSTYNPVLVPQDNPFYPSVASAMAPSSALVATNPNNHAQQPNIQAPQPPNQFYHSHDAVSTSHPVFAGGEAASYYESPSEPHTHNHNHNHDHNPPPPLRQSFKKLWENLCAEERHAVGQFELYSEIEGVCDQCFTPGTSYTQAPRAHHYGQRWSKSKGAWRVRRSNRRRVWMAIFRKGDPSGSSCTSSSSSSSSSSNSSDSDSGVSATTARRRKLNKQIERERKKLEQQERRELCQQRGHTRNCRCSSTQRVLGTSCKHVSAASTTDITSDSLTKTTVFHDSGYGPGGKACPKCYSEGTNRNKSSGFIMGSWLESSKNGTTSRKNSGHTRTTSQVSVASSSASTGPHLFEVPSSASPSDDGLIYDSSSSSSLGARRKTGWFFHSLSRSKSKPKKKNKGKGKNNKSSSSLSSSSSPCSSTPSEDGLIYGSGKETSVDSASIRSNKSYAVSTTSSLKSAGSRVFGVQRRRSWDDIGTPSNTKRNTDGAAVGFKRSNSTGYSIWGRRSETTTKTAASTQGGWFSGGGRKAGGWFGGAETATTRTSRSQSLSSRGSSEGGQEGVETAIKKEPWVYGNQAAMNATQSTSAISSTLVGTQSDTSTHIEKSYSTTDITSRREKAREPSTDGQVFITLPSGERRSTKEVWVDDRKSRDKRSPEQGAKRTSSVDSWKSFEPRSQHHSRSDSHSQVRVQKTATQTAKSNFFSSLLAGRSETFSERSKKETKKAEEAKKSKVLVRDGKITKGKSRSSSVTVPPEEPITLTKVYPMATKDPERFDTIQSSSETDVTRRETNTSSFVRDSYSSKQHEASSSYTMFDGKGASIIVGGSKSTDQRRPLPVPIQAAAPPPITHTPDTASITPNITPISTTIINTTIHHTTNTSNTNNNNSSSTSYVNIGSSPVTVLPVHSVSSGFVEHSQSHSNAKGYSASLVQDIAAATATQVAAMHAKDRAEHEEREKLEIMNRERHYNIERERSEQIQRELAELREREEKAALLHKEKSDREERERRALRLAIEQKEKEEVELKLKREREERAAIELKRKLEWEAREKAEDDAARLSRQKQDEERLAKIKSMAEKEYREWCSQQTLQRLQREKENDEFFRKTKKELEERSRELEKQAATQKAVEEAWAVEVEKKHILERELQVSKDEEKKRELRRVDISNKLEEKVTEVQRLQEEKAHMAEQKDALASQQQGSFIAGAELQQKKDAYDHTAIQGQKSSLEVQRMEFLEEQDRIAQAAKALEETRRVRFELEVHGNRHEQRTIETQRTEVAQEHQRTVEKLSKLEQVAIEAHRSKDQSKVREVQHQIQVEQEKETRLRIEEEKKATAINELKKQEDLRVQSLELQIADEKKRDQAALIEGQRIVAAEMEAKKLQQEKKIQQLESLICAGKEKEDQLKMEEGQRVLDQMEQTRIKDERAREYIAQFRVEEEKSMQVQIEKQKTSQAESEFVRKQEEAQDFIRHAASEAARIEMRKADQEKGQVETRRETRTRIETERSIEAIEEKRREERAAQEEVLDLEDQDREILTEEEQIIRAEVQRRWENEKKQQKRSELEKEVANLQRQIAEKEERDKVEREKREKRRARSREKRAQPGYQEREARRSRERSKKRDSQAAVARREEIEFVREQAGLDKTGEKEKKKRAYSPWDPLPNGDIPGFAERKWSIQNGVPRLIETPPTPPPGTPRFPQRVHCEGSYFPPIDTQTDPSIPVVPALPSVYAAQPAVISPTSEEFEKRSRPESASRPQVITETSAEFEKRVSGAESRTEVSRSLTSSETQTTIDAARKVERSITSSEFEETIGKSSDIDVRRVEPVRAVTSSETENISGTAVGSQIINQSVASTEGTKASGYGWGSIGNFGSGLMKAATSVISETPSFVGNSFTGTPAAPVPTVPNLGSAVINYQQKDDSEQQELHGDSQAQEQVYQGPQSLPSPSDTPAKIADVNYGPELPPYLINEASSAMIQSNKSSSQSQSNYQQASSDYSIQQITKPMFSEVVYGPILPPNYPETQSSQDSKDAWHQSIYDQMSSDYIRSKESSDVEYGPVSLPVSHATGEFRLPGAFDDEEVAPDVLVPQAPRDEKTSANPIYRESLSNESHSLSESVIRNHSESTSREASSFSQEVEFGGRQISYQGDQTLPESTNRPVILGENRSVSEYTRDNSTESASKSASSITQETRVDMRNISHENNSPAATSHRPALATGSRSMSESSKNIYSSESTSRLASSFSREIDSKEGSQEDQISSAQINRPALESGKRAFSESASTLYSADSDTRSTSTTSRDQFQTPPISRSNESTPTQDVSGYRQRSSPPNVFAFEDNEASSTQTAAIGTGRSVSDDGKRLTREKKDQENELMAIATASAESAGFDPGLILGNIQPHRLSTVIEAGETTPSTTTGRRPSIARPRSAFIEEVEDEDNRRAKRQLGQHEFSAEAYLSHAEILAREEARSRSEQQLASGSRATSPNQDVPPLQPLRPNPAYSSTPEGSEFKPEYAPPPQPTDLPVDPVELPQAHSAPPSEVIQERKTRAHGVTRSVPASRSASVSGSLGSMDSVREEEGTKRPSTSRSSSLSGFFRRKKKDDTPSLADSGVGFDTDDGTRRGRVPRSEEEETQESGGSRGRRERSSGPRLQRQATEQPSQSLPRRSTDQWDRHAAEDQQNLPRRSTDSVVTTHESQSHENEPQSSERHSRRSIDSAFRHQEGIRAPDAADIDEEEGSKAETESLHKSRSKMKKVANVGKMFAWANRSKREKSSSRSREASQTRGESVRPTHKRSVSEASGRDKPSVPGHNTEESGQFTPPQKSRTSSLRDVDMGSNYEIVEGESYAPTPSRDEPEPYVIDEASLAQRIEATMAKASQHAETKSLHYESTPVESAETPERPKSERKLSTAGGLAGVFKAARRLKRSTTTPQIPTHTERPGELTRADTDSKLSHPSFSSGGASLYDQQHTESGSAHSLQGNEEGQRVARDVSLPSSTSEESRTPLASARSGSLKRKSTKSLRSLSEAQAGNVAQSQTAESTGDGRESDSNTHLPRRSNSTERKVKETANSHAHIHDGEPVAKSYNYVKKSTSAKMLTRSEGVDLSSDFRGQHENTQSFSEPQDIFDDRDSPPFSETLPIESSSNSPLHSSTQQHIPNTFSFASRTPSSISESAAVDIYEEYPALPQSNSSSPYNLSPINQNIASEQLPVHDEEIPDLPFGGPPYVQTRAAGTSQPQLENQTQSPFMNFFQSAFDNFPVNTTKSPSWTQLPKAFTEERSISPKDVSVSVPITGTNLPPTSLGDSSDNGILETLRSPQLSAYELQSPSLEVLKDEAAQFQDEQRPVDTIFEMLENLPPLPESPTEEFGQPIEEFPSTYDVENGLHGHAPSEPEVQYNVQEQIETNSDRSPPHPSDIALESSSRVPENEPHIHPSQAENKMQPQLPPLKTEFEFPDMNGLPQLPPSSSSLVSLDWVSAGPPSEHDPASVDLEETFISHFLSHDISPTSPVVVTSMASRSGSDTNPPSQPASPISQSEIERNESTIGNIPLHSRSPSTQPHVSDTPDDFNLGDFTSTHTVGLLECPTTTYLSFEESVRPVDSAPLSTVAEDMFCKSEPASPVLGTAADKTLQVYEPENGSSCDLPEQIYEIPDIPDREYTSLSPIFEESSVSAVSRAASAMADDFSRPASPEVSRVAPVERPQSQYNDPFASKDYEGAASTGAVLSTIEEKIPEGHPQESRPVTLEPIFDDQQSEARLPPVEYESQSEAHTISSELVATELESENLSLSQDKLFPTREPAFMPIENNLELGGQESEQTNEGVSHHESDIQIGPINSHVVGLPPTNEDIFLEAASIPLPEDEETWDCLTDSSVEPIVGVREPNIEQPVEEQTLAYTLPTNIDSEGSSHHSSFVEASFETPETISVVVEPENAPLPKDSPVLMPEEPEMTTETEVVEEHATSQALETIEFEGPKQEKTPEFSPEDIAPEYAIETETESRRNSEIAFELSPIMETEEEPDLENLPKFEGLPASEPEPRMVETFEDSNPEPGNLLRDESSAPSEPEHTVTRILEQCQEEFLAKDPPEGNASSDNTIQVESERPPMAGRDFDGKPVSPIPESSKDIGPEVSELPDEGLISPPSSTGEPITAAELAEITSERHSDSNQPDHKPLEEPEIESIIRRFSVEGTQISPLFMNDGEGSASEITPSENTLTILPSIPVEPMDTNETQTATESATQDAYEPITEGQQIEEQPIHQQRYGTPPPLEVESMIPSTQFEFSENIGIQETKIENDTRIDDQEEEEEEEGNGVKAKKGEVRGEGYDGVKEQIGTEITEDLVQIYAEPITFGTGVESPRDSLTQADTQEPDNISEETEDIGSDAWEEGVKLETSFEVEQEFVPILREEDAAQTDHQDLVTLDYIVPQSEQSPTAGQPISPDGQNMFDYVSSIMGSTPLNYSTNLQTGHMIDSDAESQNGASILKSGKEQDEAALERPTAVEQESVFEKPSSDKEGGKEQTENDYSQDDENFSAEREFTIEPPVQEIQPGSQLDAHPVEPALTLDTEPTLKETIAFEPETHEDIYLEGEHTTQENREVKSLAKNGDGPAEGKRANPQGFNLSQPASPWLEGFVDIFNLPSPQRTAVDNTIRPLEEEPILDNDHTVEDAEYEEFKEASGRPGVSVSAPSSPKFPHILVESEAPSPSLEPALPEHTESLTIHSAMQDERSLDDAKEVGKGDGLENHSLEQSESFLDLSALSPSEEPAAITESYSSKLDIEVADAGIIEPELHINAPETAAEFTVLPQESKIEENAYAPEEDRVPIKNDNVTTTEALPLSTPNFRVEQIERIAGVEQRSIHLEGEDSVKQPSVEVEASGKPYSVQEPTHEFVQSSQMAGFQPTELSRPASPVNVAEKIRKESEEQGQLQESLIHDLKEEKPSAEASQSPVIASVSIPEIEVQQSEFLLLNEKDIQENRPLMDNAEDILLNVNQGKKEYQIPPPTLESLDSSYQIPEGLIEHIPTPVTAKAKSRDIPSGSTEEVPLSTKAREDTLSPQKENNIQQSEVVQGQVMGHESVPMETSLSVASVPMTPTLSEVNKRRSKKARQREKKRKSLQGVDISGSSVASAEKPVTPSLGEFPSGVPILEAIPTENGPLITKTQPATPVVSPKKNTGSEIIENVEHRENDQVAESMSEKIKQEDKLPEADRQDDTLDQFTYDHHENPITDKSNSTSSIGTTGLDGPNQDGSETAESPVARRESSIYTQGTTKPVEEPAASQFPAALDISAPTVQPESDVPEEGVKGRLGSISLVSPPPLTHQLTPSSPSLTTPALHVGDSLGFSPKPDLRPSTPRAPQIIVDSIDSPNGPDVLPFPERRSPKVDVAHLRLPSNIPRDPSLPRILRQGSSENQSTGDLLLSEPQNFASPDPPAISTTTHNISTPSTRIYDDPEDEDPSSSFGDGELQGIPAAQVGLRSPMSVSGSKPLSFFRANVQSQRHPSQDIGIDGVTPIVKESKNLQLAPSPSFEEANKGKDGEEEEGIEFGGDHGSRDTTVITAIANEAAQSDNNEISTTNIIPQFFAKSKEAESVSKPESTSTYHTVNAEDLLSQTITNNLNPSIVFLTTQSPDLPIENYTTVETLSGGQTKSSPTVTPQKTLSPEQAPHLSRTNSTESSSTSEGVSLQPPSTSPVLENLPQIIQESPKPPPPEAGNQDEDTHIPPSEASLTPPPPLTHSSSFESTIEFWKRRSLLSTTGSIPTPQLSPYAESGASLPISFLPKSRGSSSVWPRSPVEQTSEPLNTKAKEISVNTIKATPPQAPLESRVENENLKDKVTDQSYQVSVRQGSDKNKAQVEIDLQAPVSLTSNQDRRLSQTVSLQSQDSCDSLRTVIITKDDRASSPSNSDLIRDPFLPVKNQDSGNVVPGTEELETPKRNIPNKPYESVFGPARERRISDPFLSKEGTQINSLQSFQLSQRTLGQPLTYSEKPLVEGEVRENLGSPVKLSHQPERGLSTIIEQKAEEFVRPTLLRSNTTKEREFARSEEFVKPSLPRSNTAKERDFISSDDLLSRLPTHRPLQRAKRLTPLLRSSTSPQITPVPSEKMDVLKRGERRRTITPSLRRAGSQLDSPNASTEHIIFGGGDYHPQQGKVMQKADLYESWGDKASEPKSPTRPPSIRRRQSMQIVDLEDRLEGLAAENTSLIQEKANVEKTLSESIQRHRQDTAIFTQEIEEKKALLTEKDSEITELRKKLEYYHTEVQRLSQANSSLNKTNTSLSTSYKFSYGALAGKYERKREQLATLSKEHSELQASFANVQATMENVIRDQLKEKDSELERLRDELTKAREEVRKLREQATTRQDNKYLDTKDLHHFSSSCQQLYSSLKIWCNQFSSFSLGKKCVHVHRLKDEAVRDRVEHVMLDDRGVRKMLKDENKRSEVFMAITMRMIWEHVFTRYLFGLEVDERKKLISLETTLAEVGLHEAVHQWRSTTLTLLSTRPAIKAKREVDAEEIVQTIYNLLNFLLPPPLQYRSLALESLRSLVQHSVQLAVEMRTQRAEYVMKRPPRPDYDDQGEVTNTVPFVASTMQNRGSEPASAQELEDEGATVKLILFPQVIRRGNEYGENYDAEVTVLPMQVLVNRPQLRSESRASNKSVSSVWREQHHGGVSRLTPITDSSPMETPKTTPEKARITAQSILPAIPEQTIRLVQEDVAASRGYPFPNIED